MSETTLVYVLHDFLKACDNLEEADLTLLRKERSLTTHMDLFVLTLEEAQSLKSENSCFTLCQEAHENNPQVQEVADQLYSDAYPGEIYDNPFHALQAAIMIEKD